LRACGRIIDAASEGNRFIPYHEHVAESGDVVRALVVKPADNATFDAQRPLMPCGRRQRGC
jgi:hypothetical protein